MQKFFSSTKFKVILCVCVALLMGIFVAAVSDNGSSPLSSAISFVTTPLNSAAARISQALGNFRTYFTSSAKYAEEVQSLQAEVDSFKQQLVDYEKLRQKLEAYEAFLDVKEENPDYSFVSATIILRDTSDVYLSFTLNKGLKDGVELNSPVIYGNFLVGVVREISESSCVVYTVYNPKVSIAAYEIRTREDCYIEAETALSRNGMLKLSGLSRSTPVVSGGIVCTSGIGGLFPRDLIIGTVTEVFSDETDISAYATVTPDMDITHIVDVFIITDFDGKGE